MRTIDTIIIGGGQAGLAMSRSLTERGVEHVVLERGRIGERWRSERWDSLRLLTPRWMARLPGWEYEGPDPDGYMTSDELVDYLERYAASFDAPLRTGVTVERVSRLDVDTFHVETDDGEWRARNVVLATGDCDTPHVPAVAEALDDSIEQHVPTRYRRPSDLPEGGVMVVGASATGIQLAAEIHASGRPVTLAVGRHTRLPRSYRGRDILWWFDRMGVLDERATSVYDIETSRTQPSMQLVGTPDHRSIDLGLLQRAGIRLAGRVASIDGHRVRFEDDLFENVVAADVKLGRLRMRIDRFASENGLDDVVPAADEFEPIDVVTPPTEIDLSQEGIRSVLWATGFVRRYDWLDVAVLDGSGEIEHEGGVTKVPGLYVMGLRFLRHRSSSFIDGQRLDAEQLADHLVSVRASEEVAA